MTKSSAISKQQQRQSQCQRIRHNGRRRRINLATLFALSSMVITPSESLVSPSSSSGAVSSIKTLPTTSSQQRHEKRVSTRRFFRHTSSEDASDGIATNAGIDADAIAAAAFVNNAPQYHRPQYVSTPIQQQQQQHHHNQQPHSTTNSEISNSMPTWLQNLRGHMYEENIQRLQEAMKNSFFTESEALRIVYAIEVASKGDRNKISGAAEFCLIMVETMEMGTNALIAAVFHYCSCVTAREEEQKFVPPHAASVNDGAYYKHLVDSAMLRHEADGGKYGRDSKFVTNVRSFGGDHAVSIALDAARLKKVENVACSIMSLNACGQVSPDKGDAENLRKLLLAETKDWRALAIRSAACLYRLRGIMNNAALSSPSSYGTQIKLSPEINRVCREALHIYAPLASQLGMHRLKNELESTAFRILYRRQYNAVSSLTRQSRRQASQSGQPQSNFLSIEESMSYVLTTVKDEVRGMLENDDQFRKYIKNFAVTARVKESYSMWLKMLRNGWDHILQVPDALALRIVFDAQPLSPEEDIEVTRARERALCYYVQTKCLQRWREASDPRFKDYVEQPKPNGYQSLHYTASIPWGGEDWSLEIQVRSGEMHSVAEYGLASHWSYKANPETETDSSISQAGTSTPSGCKDAYLESVQEWHWQQQQRLHHQTQPSFPTGGDLASSYTTTAATAPSTSTTSSDKIRARTESLAPYIEAFTTTQSDLARDHVFVFLSSSSDAFRQSDGKVLSLPSGACILDAKIEIEKNLGLILNWEGQTLVGVGHNGVPATGTQKLQNGDVLTIDDHFISTIHQAESPYQFQ